MNTKHPSVRNTNPPEIDRCSGGYRAITDMKITVTAISARTSKDKQAIINIMLEINDVEQLKGIIKQFKRIDEVVDVFRVKA